MEQSRMSRLDLNSYEFHFFKNRISFYDDLIKLKRILIENYEIKQLYWDYLEKNYSTLLEINLLPSDQKKVYEVINSDSTLIVVNLMGVVTLWPKILWERLLINFSFITNSSKRSAAFRSLLIRKQFIES
jgi:hypothetical protein